MLGLFGTITFDKIIIEKGSSFSNVGGILYQAGVLLGLGLEIKIYSNLGIEISNKVFELIEKWRHFDKTGMKLVSGKGNQVTLYYPAEGERIEILHSIVPAFDSGIILHDKNKLKALIAVFNSGYDTTFEHWRKIVDNLNCPIWLDIHSLALERKVGKKREYRPFTEWTEWARGVTYLQANQKEIASMLGKPEISPSIKEIMKIAEQAFSCGVENVFITLGKEGVLVVSPEQGFKITPPQVDKIIDTTGCGDVFAAATMAKLILGEKINQASRFGMELASKSISLVGPLEIYDFAKKYSLMK